VADIFVSYKKEDRALAERMVQALRAAGRSVWWDDALNPTQAWDAAIEREIAAAKHVIVLWTPRSTASDWVRSEAHYAQDHGKLVPVVGAACDLPLAFMLRQTVDLSSGPLTNANPQWVKLMGWLSGEAVDPGADAAAMASTPVKALTGERWLGPAARRPMLTLGAVAGVLIAGGVALFLTLGHFGKPPQPPVVIDPVSVANAKGLPPEFAKDLADEMSAGFASSSRISPVVGDGKRRADAYQLVSDVQTSGDKVQIFAKLFAPNIEAPVTTFKLERPATDKKLPQEFGHKLSMLTRCVATASDSNGSKLTALPASAMGPWARSCEQIFVGPATPESVVASLRTVVAEAPRFANGWSNLAENLYLATENPNSDKAALQAEALKAADKALSIEPTTAKALVVKGWGVLGYLAPPPAGSDLARLHNFAAWEALALKSIHVRPSDCGCEVPQYAGMLSIFGRNQAAAPLLEQAFTTNPDELGDDQFRAELLAIVGRASEAERANADQLDKWPDLKGAQYVRFRLAVWRGDWANARKYVDAVPDPDARAWLSAMFDALVRKDMAAARAAAAPLLQKVASRSPTGFEGLAVLAQIGFTDEAEQGFETIMVKVSPDMLTYAYGPSFAAVRRTPKFAALVERMGLMDYWKMPGHRPDFCNDPDAPALCATVAKS
jgi:hypothetical protein